MSTAVLYTGEFDFDGIGSIPPPANTAKMATYLPYLSVFFLSMWQIQVLSILASWKVEEA
jgi:hypothetical protein